MKRFAILAAMVALATSSADACEICRGMVADRSTLRQTALQARYVYAGTLSNPRINPGGLANASATDFTINQMIKGNAPPRKDQKQITIPRYLPVDPKQPAQYLVFCDVDNDGRLDVYQGTPLKSPALIEYLKEAIEIDAGSTDKVLEHAGKYLDHVDPDLASEAFLEFAKANDADVLRASKRLAPDKVRKLLDDAKTPQERMGLFVSMLGACGSAEDAARFQQLLAHPGERFRAAQSGLYAGYIMLQPAEGWKTLQATLADPKRPYTERVAALTALRFFYNADPKAVRSQAVAGLQSLVTQDDLADYAIEDMRKWQIWELSSAVVAQYGKKGFDAPLMRRAILRYALSCPDPNAKTLVTSVRATKPDLVADVEESLERERLPAKPEKPYNTSNR
ncbi:MAG: hypothetical protein ACJ8C4_19015 [Gemmataceae bacterium]